MSRAFGDHMVLQREFPAPIWGWTHPGAEVVVSVGGKRVSTRADASGKWLVRLPRFRAGGPYEVVVEGPQRVVLRDVLFGDVWICSGQSNMEQGVAISKNAEAEIAAARHPQIRLFRTERRFGLRPEPMPEGQWQVCSPEAVSQGGWGGFSAVAYFFGRDLQRELGVPIGLIQACWGGTVAEAWTSAQALTALPDFRPVVEELSRFARDPRAFEERRANELEQWIDRLDLGTKEGWQATDRGAWRSVETPTYEAAGLTEFDGIVWFRATFDLGDGRPEQDAWLVLGAIDDQDTVWVNGRLVGSKHGWQEPRRYRIPASALRTGRNDVAVRVLDTGGPGGLRSDLNQLYVQLGDRTLPLTEWRFRPSGELPKALRLPGPISVNPNTPTALFNGMIHPWLPFGIKGSIWYQGESNVGRAYQYRSLLPAMIADWRLGFQSGKFPFLIVQLANYLERSPAPGDDAWAELREAQSIAAKRAGKSAVAVIIDAGEANDIHPKDKQTVGRRLALAALSVAYGRRGPLLSPEYRRMTVVGSKAVLEFQTHGSFLVSRNGPPRGFAIAGADRIWRWAQAEIVGRDRIAVHSREVPAPAAVRYAWAANPVANVYSAEGLPLSPFRTDDWPMLSGPSGPSRSQR
ncbi:MAG: hypothetical protein N2109_01110 [Fimbriimonadales bacterium]|nr:hypothetical protein [Fimbriimonadales bacterium]